MSGKIVAKNEIELETSLKTNWIFSKDVGMNFRMENALCL